MKKAHKKFLQKKYDTQDIREIQGVCNGKEMEKVTEG